MRYEDGKVGMHVKCVDATDNAAGSLFGGLEYVIRHAEGGSFWLEGVSGGWDARRFEPITEEKKMPKDKFDWEPRAGLEVVCIDDKNLESNNVPEGMFRRGKVYIVAEDEVETHDETDESLISIHGPNGEFWWTEQRRFRTRF